MQLALQYADDERAKTAWANVRVAFAAVVESVGLKEVAYRLDVKPSQLSDSLTERDRHRIAGEWIARVLTFAPPMHRAALVAALCDAGDYEGAKPRMPKTPTEELDAMQRYLAEKFPGALEQYRKERR